MSFKQALEVLPVVADSLWQAGSHRFFCGDSVKLFQSGRWNELFPMAECVYTDPPWNEAIQKRFHDLAGLPPSSQPFSSFLGDIPSLLKGICPQGTIACEMGLKSYPVLKEAFNACGAVTFAEGTGTYGHQHTPNSIWFGSFGAMKTPFDAPCLHGKEMARFVVQAIKSDATTFCDPFCGQLLFVQEAIRQGLTCFGCELIPSKLARGLITLSKNHPVQRLL